MSYTPEAAVLHPLQFKYLRSKALSTLRAAAVRQALYMPALVAARFNPDMKAKYAHLIETGKPAKVALTAIMRKLVVLANALLKANRTWTLRTA
jgi:transposase